MDRLSELPDALIFHIFWFLPMSDVVRTSILSNRWKDLWTTTPSFNFQINKKSLQNFVNRALIRWNGKRIEKFKVESCIELEESVDADIDSWVCFAMNRKVEELYLHILLESLAGGKYDPEEEVYTVPQCLYSSCPSLKELSFRHCEFKINRIVQWNKLKHLTISQGFGLTEDVINHILSGSPQLEVLILSFVEGGASLSIRSQSLKELSIYKYLFNHSDLSVSSKLRIWGPKLENLRIEGIPYSKCLLADVSSLTHATLGFSGLHDGNWDEHLELDSADKHESFSGPDFVGDKISQILQTIQLVENVTLSCCCIKVLGAIEKRSFPKVKLLKIGYCNNDIEQLVDLLEIFPQLKRLVLQPKEGNCSLDEEEKSIKFDAKSYQNLPSSFLLQLRIVDVTWVEGDTIFPFIKVLFKYASSLEKMVFRVGKNRPPAPPSTLNMASQKLLTMPRSSPSCTIDFLCDVTN